MIVVRKITHGVVAHAGARFNEWLGGAAVIAMGGIFASQAGMFNISPSFTVMGLWFAQAIWANIFLTSGLIRSIALVINGTFPISFRYSPIFRFLASWMAMMSWGAVSISTYLAWENLGGAPTAPLVYGVLCILEIRNVYLCRVDMLAAREASNARAGK